MNNVAQVLNAASLLNIEGIIKKVHTLLTSKVDEENFLFIRSLAKQFSLMDTLRELDGKFAEGGFLYSAMCGENASIFIEEINDDFLKLLKNSSIRSVDKLQCIFRYTVITNNTISKDVYHYAFFLFSFLTNDDEKESFIARSEINSHELFYKIRNESLIHLSLSMQQQVNVEDEKTAVLNGSEGLVTVHKNVTAGFTEELIINITLTIEDDHCSESDKLVNYEMLDHSNLQNARHYLPVVTTVNNYMMIAVGRNGFLFNPRNIKLEKVAALPYPMRDLFSYGKYVFGVVCSSFYTLIPCYI